tara:strand:+ start:89 stop:580 length:492 start_codon:yes stop_codon:yes gene_type:complete
MTHLASITLGSNIGDKVFNIKKAIDYVSKSVEVKRISNYYETEPWGYESKNSFVNAGIIIETIFSPEDLLLFLKKIEKKMGRQKTMGGYQDRIIDLDILTFGHVTLSTTNLVIPHPKIAERKFSIVILKDLFLDEVIPSLNKSALELLQQCEDNLKVQMINEV